MTEATLELTEAETGVSPESSKESNLKNSPVKVKQILLPDRKIIVSTSELTPIRGGVAIKPVSKEGCLVKDISLVVPNAETQISLKAVIPSHYSIVCCEGGMFCAKADREAGIRQIVYPHLETETDLILLLHEIGHAHNEELFVPPAKPENRSSQIIISERAAWAWALNFIHQKKNQGIDICPTTTQREIIKIAESKLRMYRASRTWRPSQSSPQEVSFLSWLRKQVRAILLKE